MTNKITKFFKKILKISVGTIIGRAIIGVLIGFFWFASSSNESIDNNFPDFPSIIFLSAFIMLFIIRLWFALKAGKSIREKKYVKFDVPKYLAVIGFLIPFIWLATDLLDFANYSSNEVVLFVGTPLLIISIWILYKSHAELDKQLSPTLEIQKGHQLVTTGIYKNIRHPMYLGFLLFTIGQIFVVPNYIAGPSGLIGIIFLIALRLKNEEKMLKDNFGNKYDSYCKNTKKIIPKIW